MKKELTLEQREAKRLRQSAWAKANRRRIAAYALARKLRDPIAYKETQRVIQKRYRKTHPRKGTSPSSAAWKTNNKERTAEYARGWYLRNKEKAAIRWQRWSREHPETVAALTIKRRLRLTAATPKWADQDGLKIIYRARQILALTFPELGQIDVDHVIPLKGKTASGLHVPRNLRIITAIKNRRKQNTWPIS